MKSSLFISPHTLWSGGQTFVRARVNGEWKTLPSTAENWKTLSREVIEGRAAQAKARRLARLAAVKS